MPRPLTISSHPALTLALGGAAVLVLVASLAAWSVLAASGRFLPVDFPAFYAGAAIVRDGLGGRLYNLDLQAAYQLRLLGYLPLNGHVLPFVSPPHVALLLVPLTALPLDVAYTLWLAVEVLLVGLVLYQVARADAERPLVERILILSAIASFSTLFVAVYKGQLTPLLLLGLIGWGEALRRGHDLPVACWLLVGTVKPQAMLPALIVTLLARRWRALGQFAAGLALLSLASALLLGPGSLWRFVEIVRFMDATFDQRLVYPAFMSNLKGALTLALGPSEGPLVISLARVGWLAGLLALPLIWRGRVEVADPHFELRLALGLGLSVFLIPHLYYYDTALMLAPAWWCHRYLRGAPHPIAARVLLLGLFVSSPLFLERMWVAIGSVTVSATTVIVIAWSLWMAVLLGAPAGGRRAGQAFAA